MTKLVFCVSAVAAWSTIATGGPCLPGTLQSYINLGAGGCQSGAVQFGSFLAVPGQFGAAPIDPGQVQVTPGGSQFNPLLLLTLNRTATGAQLFESIFRFTAMGPLEDVSIALNSPTATGNGVVTGILDVCPGANFAGSSPAGCPKTPASLIAFKSASDAQLSAGTLVTPSSFFDVFVDLTVDGGLNGTATLSSAAVGISAAPEPSSVFLIAAGLGAIWVWRRRRTGEPGIHSEE